MSQTMKPITAATKLGIYLPAAPQEFRETPITRAELDALRNDPPAWLRDLLRNGPFPRDVVAANDALGVVTVAWSPIGRGAYSDDPVVRAVAGVGFLGGFTTFSTASVELVRLVRADRPWAALFLATAMVGVSVGAALVGLLVGGAVG